MVGQLPQYFCNLGQPLRQVDRWLVGKQNGNYAILGYMGYYIRGLECSIGYYFEVLGLGSTDPSLRSLSFTLGGGVRAQYSRANALKVMADLWPTYPTIVAP